MDASFPCKNDKASVRVHAADVTKARPRPTIAERALPPSKPRIGSMLMALVNSPTKPIHTAGWTGIGCAIGRSISLGARIESMAPVKKLPFSDAIGTTGNVAKTDADELRVAIVPAMRHPIDVNIPARGPLTEMSNKASKFGGKER